MNGGSSSGDKDTCVAPVNDIREALADPHLLDRRMILHMNHPRVGPFTQIGFPIKLSETPAEVRSLGKTVGTDTERILDELGYSQEDLTRLRQRRAIG